MDGETRYRQLLNNMDNKIDFEFEQFFTAIVRTSKANIFARSREIEIKKQIAKHLRAKLGGCNEEQLNRLFSHINLLEECYRYNMDHPCADVGEQIDLYLSRL